MTPMEVVSTDNKNHGSHTLFLVVKTEFFRIKTEDAWEGNLEIFLLSFED